MSALRATVRSGRLVVDEPIDLPEGAQVQLYLVDVGDELDDEERAALDDAIDAAAESVARGEVIDADEVIAHLRARGPALDAATVRRHGCSMPEKDDIAAVLANAHREVEPTILTIIRIISDAENQNTEPIKLLEVNPATSPSGIVPIAFSPDPPSVPFPSIIVEVTQREFDDIRAGRLQLPNGWRLGDTLYRAMG